MRVIFINLQRRKIATALNKQSDRHPREAQTNNQRLHHAHIAAKTLSTLRCAA